MRKLYFRFFLLCGIFLGCARAPIKSVDQAMRPSPSPSEVGDDLGLLDLAKAIEMNIAQLKVYGAPLEVMRFGPVEMAKSRYIAALQELVDALKIDISGRLFLKKLNQDFEFYEVYGDEKWGQVFVTSYYEPVIQGQLKKKKPYTQPLYGVPKDLVTVNLSEYSRVFPDMKPYQTAIIEQKSRDGVLRGRLDSETSSVLPYYSREEIDGSGVLHGESPVLCYVDPVDAFFLQIQGSGRVELPGGKILKLGYGAQNGHPYRAIGKLLFDVIPKEKMTAQKIATHLRALEGSAAQKIMNANPSYVFFKKLESEPLTYFGTEVVEGRTIATDSKYFPKGALAYLEYEKPAFDKPDSDEVREYKKSSRFVLDQDVGGAIRGPHRVDLFWGRGPEAAQVSGVMRNEGRLYYILPKKRAL